MLMPVVDIRVMRVAVLNRRVDVPVAVGLVFPYGLPDRFACAINMRMLVVFVVRMRVIV